MNTEGLALGNPQSSQVDEINERLDAIEEKLNQPVEVKLVAAPWVGDPESQIKAMVAWSKSRRPSSQETKAASESDSK